MGCELADVDDIEVMSIESLVSLPAGIGLVVTT